MARMKSNFAQLMIDVNEEVFLERMRQNEKFGVQRRLWGQWLAILGEEYGEVCQAMQFVLGVETVKDTDSDNLYEELMHLAAVASAMAEQWKEEKDFDNGDNARKALDKKIPWRDIRRNE